MVFYLKTNKRVIMQRLKMKENYLNFFVRSLQYALVFVMSCCSTHYVSWLSVITDIHGSISKQCFCNDVINFMKFYWFLDPFFVWIVDCNWSIPASILLFQKLFNFYYVQRVSAITSLIACRCTLLHWKPPKLPSEHVWIMHIIFFLRVEKTEFCFKESTDKFGITWKPVPLYFDKTSIENITE